jgi:hypothetical protein
MLVLTRSAGTAVMIGDHIVLKVIQVNGDKVRVGIETRKELWFAAKASRTRFSHRRPVLMARAMDSGK